MDFAELKDATNRWSERTFDDADLNQFVELAEARIRRNLTGYQRELVTTLTTDGDGFADLPTDFIGFVGISLTSQPYRYSIGGGQVYVPNGASRTFDAIYYGTLPALSDSNTTNWLLETAPDVYLWLVKAQAREFNEEWELASGLEAKGLAALSDLNLQSTVSQYGRAGMNLPVQAF